MGRNCGCQLVRVTLEDYKNDMFTYISRVRYDILNLMSLNVVWDNEQTVREVTTISFEKQEGSNFPQHDNTFNTIIIDQVSFKVKVNDEYKKIIFCARYQFLRPPGDYFYLHKKNTTNLDVITTTLMSYLQSRKNLMEETQDEAMYVKGRRNHG